MEWGVGNSSTGGYIHVLCADGISKCHFSGPRLRRKFVDGPRSRPSIIKREEPLQHPEKTPPGPSWTPQNTALHDTLEPTPAPNQQADVSLHGGCRPLHGGSRVHHTPLAFPLLEIANHGPHVGLLAGAGLTAHNGADTTVVLHMADRERATVRCPSSETRRPFW